MHLNLHTTYWSLMLITLISSCFLFYVVTSENAKLAETTTAEDASMASGGPLPRHTSASATPEKTSSKHNVPIHAAAAGDPEELEKNALYKEKSKEILPNYKKVKKLISEQPTVTPAENNINADINLSPSPKDKHVLSSPIEVINDEVSEISDDITKSSDSSLNVNNANSDSVENINLFNTIEANTRNINENEIIHSSIDALAEINSNQAMTDVEFQAENADISKGLPDITDIPTVTVTELPLEVLQQPQNTLDSVIIDDGTDRSQEETVNRTIEVIPETEEEKPKDDQTVKINDSGGSANIADTMQPKIVGGSITPSNQEVPSSTNNIPTDTNNISSTESSISAGVEQEEQKHLQNASSTSSDIKLNLTATEEVPIPVFSEWAQKQMEAAEKQEALEQEQTVNNSAQRKNNTNGNGKPTSLKIRAKNYASPDCGAKIIASSAYTNNAGAVLSSSKDEYMLSLCGNRIWFVVELCEAIQAQKIDVANFELYSSSPQNLTVAVSKRFPTREWSNVGRFKAEDKRTVQSFDLHPHLFGKFVRVDINSHYSKEHFCTLSLFRVFGTSEFEAFETENHPNEDLDDFDDEYLLEQNTVKHPESNLFKSASDAVLSIVKKATEVLGKPTNSLNQTFKTQAQSVICSTPIYGLFSCTNCPTSLVEKVNNILTCEFLQLNSLLSNKDIRNDLLNTQVCAKHYGIETKQVLTTQKDIRRSFYVNILPIEYVGALCQLLIKSERISQDRNNATVMEEEQKSDASELPTNLTIDKKFGKDDLNLLDHPEKKLIKPEVSPIPIDHNKVSTEYVETSTELSLDDNQQLPRPLQTEEQLEDTTLSPKIVKKPNLPDTNIFNVPADELSSENKVPVVVTEFPTSAEIIEETPLAVDLPDANATPMPPLSNEHITASSKSEEDSNSWDNIDHLLTTVPSTITTSHTAGSGQYNNQHKNSNGPQSESVFIRLSNRIKALERNMSLSGQYLEELSRRYKKQVEELQQTLTQQVQIVRALEEESRRHHELEKLFILRNTQLKDELDNLTLQVHASIVVIIFVGAFVFLVLMVAILFYRSLKRETKEVLSLYDKVNKKKNDAITSTTKIQKKINRRKSFEDFSDHQSNQEASNISNNYSDTSLRSSEEAVLISEDCKNNSARMCQHYRNEAEQEEENAATTRQRKLSVFYATSNNISQSNNECCSGLPPHHVQKSQNKRKGEKHSWPSTGNAQLLIGQHVEELNEEDLTGNSSEISARLRKSSALNSKSRKKKEAQSLKRQQSLPAESSFEIKSPTTAELSGDFDERIMLDEDDLDNFIPNTDLAYNEFMPDGPRGYQCAVNPNSSKKITNKQLDNNLKKSRRLSSPVFFKSPFTKSLKGKISNSNKSNPAHESTSWEWYRLKKSTSSASSSIGGGGDRINNPISNSTNNTFLRASPNTSLDSSSLSEINFPTNSTENSFRILEEAILTSGESAIAAAPTVTTNCKKSSIGLINSSNSNHSSSSNSSTQSKKKNRSFNKIFRKVF